MPKVAKNVSLVAAGRIERAIFLIRGQKVMLDEKVERFREEVHHEFGKVDRRFLHLDARIAVLENR